MTKRTLWNTKNFNILCYKLCKNPQAQPIDIDVLMF